MQQLSIFDSPKKKVRTGFKYRRRLYNDKGNYLYTAIPTETGYKLNSVSTLIQRIGILELTHDEYAAYLKERSLIEKLPKDVEGRLK